MKKFIPKNHFRSGDFSYAELKYLNDMIMSDIRFNTPKKLVDELAKFMVVRFKLYPEAIENLFSEFAKTIYEESESK